MKYKLLFGVCTVSFVILCAVSYAEDLGHCKTMFNGQCTEYYAPIGAVQEQCKTMQNGECIEYYNGTYNENKYIQTRRDLRSLNTTAQNKVCNNTFGFYFILDPYATNVWSWQYYNQSKVFITSIIPSSPASKVGLNVGDEITRINGIKVVKFKAFGDFSGYLDGQSTIKLDVKTTKGDKKSVTLNKIEICKMKQEEPLFNSYWGQVCSQNLDSISEYFEKVGQLSNKLTPAIRSEIVAAKNENEQWLDKRAQFRKGFDLCLTNSLDEREVNACLNMLVNRFITTLTHEQNIKMQRETVQTQREMQQQQIEAINNYSNALQNQHMYVNTNVYHHGSVNHNVDVNSNVNVNGVYRYYRY